MFKIKWISEVLIFLYFTSISITSAQNLGGRVSRFSIQNGLSSGVVNSIAQDNTGLIWIGTSDGLNRFDGNLFKTFKHDTEDKNSLAGNYVKSILKDSDGTIWVSSRNGLNEYIASKEQFVRHIPSQHKKGASDDVSDISAAKDGNLWISLNGTGFAKFNKKSKNFIYYDKKNLTGLKTNAILNVFQDSQGIVWLGSRDSGFECFQESKNGSLNHANLAYAHLPKSRINQIFEDRLHNIWIASANGLFLYKRQEKKFYTIRIKTFHESNIYLSLTENRQGNLFVGVQDGGVYSLDLNTMKDTTPEKYNFEQVKNTLNQGITQRSIPSMYKDKDENIWLGTYGEGVYMISSIPEKFILRDKKIADSRAESNLRYYGMCLDKNGHLWLGTDGEGIYKTTSAGEVIKHYKVDGQNGSITDGAIIAAYRDSDDNLWFGSYSKGLFRYNPLTDSFTNFTHKANDSTGLPSNDVRVIFEDSKKILWVGTNGGGLARFNPKTERFTSFNPSNSSINSNDVRALTEDRQGNLWIGTYGGGLNYLDTNTMRFTQKFNSPQEPNYLSNRIVFSLFLDQQNRLWIGSEGNGLLLYDTAKNVSKLFSAKNGLSNNVINSIQPDNDNKLWISTNSGISRIDLTTYKIDNFNQSDGLQRGQFNPGSVLYNKKENYICFGGTEGYNLFYPKKIKTSTYQPTVLITGLQLFGKNVEIGSSQYGTVLLTEPIVDHSEITLQPDQSVFSIQFTALNYAYPEKTQFAYILDGMDKDWNYVQNEFSATYRHLPPGDYIFKVRAANQDGIWFDDYKSLVIHILSPWYQSWWAYIIYAIFLASVLYYFQKYKTKQTALKFAVQRAQFETLKEKEIHERKIAYFTNISHEFRTPLTLIINPVKELLKTERSEDTLKLKIIYRNAKRLLSLADQLLLFRKADQKEAELSLAVHHLPTLIREVFHCFVYQAEQKHIQYEFLCSDETLNITADIEKLEIALFNLISNAIKFTPEYGKVTVVLSEKDNQVEILIQDTGIGIPKDAGDHIYNVFHQYSDTRVTSQGGFGIGLFLAKTFIENHFGTLSYESVLKEGTTFKLMLWKKHPKLVTAPQHAPHVTSVFLEELSPADGLIQSDLDGKVEQAPLMAQLNTTKATMLVVDDDPEMLHYLSQLFINQFTLLEAGSGEQGLEMIHKYTPDVVLSDVMMGGMSGIEMCSKIRADVSISHIPVILLTASSSQESKLQGIEGGADDYISKPFDNELLMARVSALLKKRSELQKYFYNEITLQSVDYKISSEYREFLERCILIVEKHITNPAFNIKVLASEIGMSQSTIYNRIKSISGQSTNSFIRFIRLRRAAQILISSNATITETAFQVGINDIKYFREQFTALFGMKPSEYIKKFRPPFHE